MERSFKISFQKGSFYGTWNIMECDIGYVVRVWDEGFLIETKYIASESMESPVLLYTPDECQEGKEYDIQLQVVSEQLEGVGKIPSYSKQLLHLRENILAFRSEDGAYLLNETVMESEELAQFLRQFLYVDELHIFAPNKEPELDVKERRLKLSGENMEVNFLVDDAMKLQMFGRVFQHNFDLFQGTVYENMDINDTSFYFTSFPQILFDGYKAERGLYFGGEITIPLEWYGPDEKMQSVKFEGVFVKEKETWKYCGKSYLPINEIVLYRRAGSIHRVQNVQMCILAQEASADIRFTGSLQEDAGVFRTVEIFYIPKESAVHIQYQDLGMLFPSMRNALEFAEGKTGIFCLPDSMRDLNNIKVYEAGYIWNCLEAGQDLRYIKIGQNDSPIVLFSQRLELSDWMLTLRCGTYGIEEETREWYGADLSGSCLIGREQLVHWKASFSSVEAWKVQLECKEGNWLSAFCNFIGLSAADIQSQLPFLFQSVQAFMLYEVSLVFLPKQQKISSVFFQLYQADPWIIFPSVLAIEDVRVSIQLKQTQQWEWETAAGGFLRIGSGEDAAEIFVSVPLAQNMASVLIESRESGIRLPSLKDLLRVVGIETGNGWMPEGIWNLDELKISRLKMRWQLIPDTKLEGFSFGISTSRSYTFVLEQLEFSIKKLEILLEQWGTEAAVFTARGEFSLFGMDAEAEICIKNDAEDLILSASLTEEECQALEFKEMADTFASDEIGKYDNLPVPAEFGIPHFQKLAVYMDSGQGLFVLRGRIDALGQSFFVNVKQEESTGYLLAIDLDESFTFKGFMKTLDVLDDFLNIKKAGMILASMDIPCLARVFQDIPGEMLPAVPAWKKSMRPGLFWYGEILLQGIVTDRLLRLGDEQGRAHLIAYADLPKPGSDTEIYVSMNEFLLLGVFQFQDICFCYRIRQENQFELSGRLSIQIGDSVCVFKGVLLAGETRGLFEVMTNQSIRNPLGLPGITLQNLAMRLDVDFSQKTETVSYRAEVWGSVSIGRLPFSGHLLLEEDRAKVCYIELDRSLDIDDLFRTIFTKELWPAGRIAMSVGPGELYYAQELCRLGEKKYEKGLHLWVDLTLFGCTFQITGDFSEDSFSIYGRSKESISVGILRITGANGATGPGLVFRADGKKRTLGITGGIQLFGEQLLDIDQLSYDLQERCFVGSLSYRGSVEMFHGTICFTWDEQTGIHIKEFPMQFLDEVLDYAKLLEEASKQDKSGCEALAGMLFDNVVQTAFELVPSFGEVKDGRLVMELLVKYRIIVAKKEIYCASMKKLRVEIPQPESIGFRALAEMLIHTVTDNAGSIAGQILSDTDGFLRLITAVGAVKGTQKVFQGLVCRGARETIKGMSELNTARDYANAAKSAAGPGGSSGGGSLGDAARAAAGAGGCAVSAQGYFDMAAGFFVGLAVGFSFAGGTGGSTQEADEHEKEAEKRKQEAKNAEKEARDAVRSLLAITEFSVEEEADRLLLRWNEICSEGLEVTYHIQMIRNKEAVAEETTRVPLLEIALDREQTEQFEISVYAMLIYPEENGLYTYKGETFHTVYPAGEAPRLPLNTLPGAQIGHLYECRIPIEGGVKPLRIEAHGLPEGLRLEKDVICGMPLFGGGEVLVDLSVTDARNRTIKKSYWMAVR